MKAINLVAISVTLAFSTSLTALSANLTEANARVELRKAIESGAAAFSAKDFAKSADAYQTAVELFKASDIGNAERASVCHNLAVARQYEGDKTGAALAYLDAFYLKVLAARAVINGPAKIEAIRRAIQEGNTAQSMLQKTGKSAEAASVSEKLIVLNKLVSSGGSYSDSGVLSDDTIQNSIRRMIDTNITTLKMESSDLRISIEGSPDVRVQPNGTYLAKLSVRIEDPVKNESLKQTYCWTYVVNKETGSIRQIARDTEDKEYVPGKTDPPPSTSGGATYFPTSTYSPRRGTVPGAFGDGHSWYNP